MTVKRMRYLQDFLSVMGLEDRLHLEWISSAEAQKFVQVATDFTEKIKSLGPSPLTRFNDKFKALVPHTLKGFAADRTMPGPGVFVKTE